MTLQRITIEPNQIDDRHITLNREQLHYLTRVIRLPMGGKFHAIDGKGNLYLAELASDGAQIIELVTDGGSEIDRELPLNITLICALPKGNGFDDIVRASTELGVTTILPALSDRTLLQPSPQKLLRWCKIAQEAAEQSERLKIPKIAEPQPLKTIFEGLADLDDKYICEARGEYPHLLTCLERNRDLHAPIAIAIGPEGGWTDRELNLARDRGFQPVSLGKRVLRAITAPLVALSLIVGSYESREDRAG